MALEQFAQAAPRRSRPRPARSRAHSAASWSRCARRADVPARTAGRRLRARPPSHLRAAHQPGREHASPLRLELAVRLPFASCPLPIAVSFVRRDPLELLEQFLDVADRRLCRRALRATPAVATRFRGARFRCARPGHLRWPTLSSRMSSSTSSSRIGPSERVSARIFLLSFLTFAAARQRRRSAAPREYGATRHASCAGQSVRPLTKSGHTALSSFNRLRQSLSREVDAFMLGCGGECAARVRLSPPL